MKKSQKHNTEKEQKVYNWHQIVDFVSNFRQRKRSLFYIYRHGETESNVRGLISGQEDSSLTEEGLRSAIKMADLLPSQIDGVFCSQLLRAQQTMRQALSNKHVLFEIDSRLNEFDFGLLTGKPRHFIQEFEEGDIDYRPPGGETYREFCQRLLSFIIDIAFFAPTATDSNKNYIVFAHAGILRVANSFQINGPKTSKNMFARNFKNLEALTIDTHDCVVPDFWLL